MIFEYLKMANCFLKWLLTLLQSHKNQLQSADLLFSLHTVFSLHLDNDIDFS